MTLFGKDRLLTGISSVAFLPVNDDLYFVFADGNGNLHVSQYNPEGKAHEVSLLTRNRAYFDEWTFSYSQSFFARCRCYLFNAYPAMQ